MDNRQPSCDLTPDHLGPITAVLDLWMCDWAWPFKPDGHDESRKIALHSHTIPDEWALILANPEDPVLHVALAAWAEGPEAQTVLDHEIAHAICFDLFPGLMFGDISVDRAEAAALVIEMLAPSTFPFHADCQGRCTSGYCPWRWHVFPKPQQDIALAALRDGRSDYPALLKDILEGCYGG
jgi:hypothetical protein